MTDSGGPFDADAVLRHLKEPVFVVQGDAVVFANERFHDVLEWPADSVPGADVADLSDHVVDGFDDLRDALAAVAAGPTAEKRVDLEVCHPEDAPVPERLPVEARVSPIAADDSTQGALVVFRDVTQREAREEELQRQNDRLETVVDIVSHDLRNPLNVAAGHLELASQECDSVHVEDATRALDRMEELVETLLTSAQRADANFEREPLDLASVAAASWRSVETPGATLEVEADRTIRANAPRLQQLFENLFRNSVEHGSTAGQPAAGDGEDSESGDGEDLDGEPADGDDLYGESRGGADLDGKVRGGDDLDGGDGGSPLTITVGALDESGFYVADDGPGIPSDRHTEIFETGFTTRSGGSGYGLSIVRDIVEAHGWEISITESDAGGARFEITGVEFAD